MPNPNPLGDTPLEDFWAVRASILAASQAHGVTGPDFSQNAEPRYYLVEDQYNDELYQYMEVCEPEGWTIEWISSLISCLRRHEGWGIGICSLDQAYVLLFGDRVMVTGSAFAGCTNLMSVVGAARQSAMRLHEKRYGALRRQLAYIKRRVPTAMNQATEHAFAHVATFDRYQLHEDITIWILQKLYPGEVMLDAPLAPIQTNAVTSDGVIHRQYCKDFRPYTDLNPPYWLVAYLIRDTSQREYRMLDKDEQTIGTVMITKVISDEELKRLSLETGG